MLDGHFALSASIAAEDIGTSRAILDKQRKRSFSQLWEKKSKPQIAKELQLVKLFFVEIFFVEMNCHLNQASLSLDCVSEYLKICLFLFMEIYLYDVFFL